MDVLRLVQFTDSHLYGDPAESLRGVATLPALLRTLEHASADIARADAVLMTGDVVQDDPDGYAHFRQAFGGLGRPVYCLPGNHDDLQAMVRACATPPFHYGGHADLGHWRIVLLDSVIPGSAAGRLAPSELDALDDALAGAEERPVLVCLHHHPVDLGSRWLREVALENPDAFFEVLDRRGNARAVLWGHVHQAFEGERRGVRLLATPSTCAQFLPESDDFAVDHRPPAYRLLELRADGTMATALKWVTP